MYYFIEEKDNSDEVFSTAEGDIEQKPKVVEEEALKEPEVYHETKSESSTIEAVTEIQEETEKVNPTEGVEGDVRISDVDNTSGSERQESETEKSEAVPIFENSAVSVELEPSNINSSLNKDISENIPIEPSELKSLENNPVISSEDDLKKGIQDEDNAVPSVESIPTISKICDPSYDVDNNVPTSFPNPNESEKVSEIDAPALTDREYGIQFTFEWILNGFEMK